MVIDYKKLKVGKIYRFYSDYDNHYNSYITRFKDPSRNKLIKKHMVAVYILNEDNKISYYFVGFLQKEDWGEPDFAIDGWGFDKHNCTIDDLKAIGHPFAMKTGNFSYQGLEELKPEELEILTNELTKFFNNPVEYFNNNKTK